MAQQSGSKLDLEKIRSQLTERRMALLGRINADAMADAPALELPAEDREAGDAGDGSVRDDAEDSRLIDAQRATEAVRRIDDALDRLDKGTYGLCIDCDERIPDRRLELVPEAERCVDDQERYDRQHQTGEHHPTL